MKAYFGNIYANVLNPNKLPVNSNDYKLLIGYHYGTYKFPSNFQKQIDIVKPSYNDTSKADSVLILNLGPIYSMMTSSYKII